jgi:hypothetical protein
VALRGLWVAAVVVAFLYLVLRPHFGTVYYLNAAHAPMPPAGKASIVNSTAVGHSLFMPAAPAGISPTFTNERDCQTAAASYSTPGHAFGGLCAQRTALLWGW